MYRRSVVRFAGPVPLSLASLFVMLAVLMVAAATLGKAHARDVSGCSGRSLLPEIAEKHPEIHKRLMAQSKDTANTEAVLWKITKSGDASFAPSYLFGAMHVSDPRITNLPEPVRQALEGSKLVALEIEDLSPMAMLNAVQGMPQLLVYLDGSTLQQKVTPEEFAAIQKLVGGSGVPAEMAGLVRPWLVMTMLALPACEKARAANGTPVLDKRIQTIAEARKIPVVGLESVAEQLKIMASVPDRDQVNLLKLSLAYFNRAEDQFETLLQAYEKRQLGVPLHLSRALAEIKGMTEHGIDAFEQRVLFARNQTMFETSQPLVDQGQAFIAVGALHLVGGNGLVALYRAAGFTVTPVI